MAKYGLALTSVIYVSVAVIGILMFGPGLTSSVLDNIGMEYIVNSNPLSDKKFIEAYIVQIAFMIVLACHIPYVFFAGKEGLCIFVDELDRKSISNVLWAKYQDHDEPPNPNLPLIASTEDIRKSYSEMVLKKS
jgi:hypothetical protein